MVDYPVSDELRAQLDGQKTLGTMAPTIEPNWFKWANDTIDAGTCDSDHSPSGGKEFRPNTKTKPRVRAIPGLPGWHIIDCEGL